MQLARLSMQQHAKKIGLSPPPSTTHLLHSTGGIVVQRRSEDNLESRAPGLCRATRLLGTAFLSISLSSQVCYADY